MLTCLKKNVNSEIKRMVIAEQSGGLIRAASLTDDKQKQGKIVSSLDRFCAAALKGFRFRTGTKPRFITNFWRVRFRAVVLCCF